MLIAFHPYFIDTKQEDVYSLKCIEKIETTNKSIYQ
jgi:hypothetical protein